MSDQRECFRPRSPHALSAPAMRVNIEIQGFTLVETMEATNVRFGSLADINASDEKGPLSGVKQTLMTAQQKVRF